MHVIQDSKVHVYCLYLLKCDVHERMNLYIWIFPLRNASSADSASSLSNGNALTLQDLIEKVVLLKKAVEKERKQFDASSSNTLQSKLRLYASLLASQGSLGTALSYLQQAVGDQVRNIQYIATLLDYIVSRWSVPF